MHANRVLILGHTSTGMGERSVTQRFASFFYQPKVLDAIEVLGNRYDELAELNYELADGGYSVMEDLHTLSLPNADLTLVLSWYYPLAALLATGIQRKGPLVTKLYAHQPTERIPKPLYNSADLLITESLMANQRGIDYGFSPGKLLYFPHHYAPQCETVVPNRRYVEKLAASQGKSLNQTTRVIGTVSRLDYTKNCEFAIEAVRLLAAEGEDVVLVLKGDFTRPTQYPDYTRHFEQMIKTYKNDSWLLWDPLPTPFADVTELYASFDLLLHPSGAEGASNVVVECLGLGIPVVLLDATTNPYLFKGVANFVKTKGAMRPGHIPFYMPDLDHLIASLRDPKPPDREKVCARFHPDRFKERLSLLFDRDPVKIAQLYYQDCALYDLPLPKRNI